MGATSDLNLLPRRRSRGLGPRAAAAAAALGLALSAGAAHADIFTVDASANSSTGGVGLASLSLTAGQAFTVTASTNDLWSMGPLPRYSDANGLIAIRFATAADDSGQPVGTQIGDAFIPWVQNGLSAPFGALVGEIGGVYMLLGTDFSGTAWNSGVLNLFAWDSNNGDNSGTIAANVQAASVGGGVPEPATWILVIIGVGGVGFLLRRARRPLGKAA